MKRSWGIDPTEALTEEGNVLMSRVILVLVVAERWGRRGASLQSVKGAYTWYLPQVQELQQSGRARVVAVDSCPYTWAGLTEAQRDA